MMFGGGGGGGLWSVYAFAQSMVEMDKVCNNFFVDIVLQSYIGKIVFMQR